jgi:ABC-type branched-subunit amino acid transport system substrate-binding protein
MLLFLGIFAFVGCKSLQPAQGPVPGERKPQNEGLDVLQGTRIYDPVRQEWVIVPASSLEKMDTFFYKTVRPYYGTAVTYFPNAFPPDTRVAEQFMTRTVPMVPEKSNFPRVEKKDQYKIMVALPFTANESENAQEVLAGRVGKWAINFYGGMRLAAQEMEKEGIKLQVYVRDTKSDDSGVPALLASPDMKGTDVFIGPYRREQIRVVADQAKKEGFIQFSPYSAVAGLVQANPNFVQVNPSLEQHCRTLLRHARSGFPEENILIIYRANQSGEKTCAEYLQNANAGIQGTQEAELIPELVLDASFTSVNLAQFIKGRQRMAIIVPSWADQNFISQLLRRIAEAKTDDQEIVVYGMPQWMEFQNFEYEYFEKLHVRVSSSSFVNLQDEEVKAFRKLYFEEFGTSPDLAAYEGYGLFYFVGKMLQDYGKYFQYYMDVNPTTGLHTRFEFQSVLEPDATFQTDLLKAIARFENMYLNVLEFREYQFQSVR